MTFPDARAADRAMAPETNTTDYKLQARRLRAALAAEGKPISHSAALELVARQHGMRDWNTLAAAHAHSTPEPTRTSHVSGSVADGHGPGLLVGAAVTGRYLGQAFTGRLLALAETPSDGLFRVTIHFDEPVDVVTFESFSALRGRITAVIGRDRISPRRTSNGLPHLVIA